MKLKPSLDWLTIDELEKRTLSVSSCFNPDRLLPWREASAKLQERPLDGEKKESSCGKNTEFDAEKRGRGGEINVAICAELADGVNDEFLNQVGAVSDAGDEGGAGNCNSTKR